MMNTVILVGRLTKDAEVRYTSSNKKKTEFSIAWSYKKNSDTNFFKVEYWEAPEFIDELLKKGVEVLIDGSLKQNRWEKDGQKNSMVLVSAKFVKVISTPRQQENQTANNVQSTFGGQNISDERGNDVPF
jgi:single-strand DNA-binding protein